MPLLVGLLDSASARRSVDGSLQLEQHGGAPDELGDVSDIDLEQLAAKRTAGGGMLDSVANMANSILGAGTTATAIHINVLYAYYLHACIVGIIGNIHELLRPPNSQICLRSPIRRAASRLCNGPCVASSPLFRDRLDNTAHRGEREAEWAQLVHRDDAPLLRPKRTGRRLVLPIRVCLRRYASTPHIRAAVN